MIKKTVISPFMSLIKMEHAMGNCISPYIESLKRKRLWKTIACGVFIEYVLMGVHVCIYERVIV